MGLHFKKGTKLLLLDGTNTYEVLVSDFSISETFLEQGYSTDTIHNNTAINETVVIKSKSNANFNFSMNLSDSGVVENKVLEWYGFPTTGTTSNLPSTKDSLNTRYDVYFVTSSGLVIFIDEAILENISFNLNPRSALSWSITGSGTTSLINAVPAPNQGTLYQQGVFTNQPITAEVNSVSIDRLTGATFELTKQVAWLDGNSVHESVTNTLYIKDYAYCTGLSVSGTITKLKNNDLEPVKLDNASIKIKAGDFLEIFINNASVTERLSIASVFSQQADFRAQNAVGSYIKF